MIRLALALLAAVMALPAAAQTPPTSQRCPDIADARKRLTERFREFPAGGGPTSRGTGFITLWVGEQTWTLTLTLPDGQTCLLADGEAWEVVGGRGA